MSGLSVAEIGAAVQEAIDRRLLTYDGAAETYSLRHGLVREAIYEEMLPAERRRLHLGIAAHLERTADPNDAGVAAEIAHHCQRSGAHVRGLIASIRAAEAAERVVAHHEAVRHWVRAIDQLAVAALDAPPTVHRIDLLERGAAAANQAGDGERAVELAACGARGAGGLKPIGSGTRPASITSPGICGTRPKIARRSA